jgi:hypothetical protein
MRIPRIPDGHIEVAFLRQLLAELGGIVHRAPELVSVAARFLEQPGAEPAFLPGRARTPAGAGCRSRAGRARTAGWPRSCVMSIVRRLRRLRRPWRRRRRLQDDEDLDGARVLPLGLFTGWNSTSLP